MFLSLIQKVIDKKGSNNPNEDNEEKRNYPMKRAFDKFHQIDAGKQKKQIKEVKYSDVKPLKSKNGRKENEVRIELDKFSDTSTPAEHKVSSKPIDKLFDVNKLAPAKSKFKHQNTQSTKDSGSNKNFGTKMRKYSAEVLHDEEEKEIGEDLILKVLPL